MATTSRFGALRALYTAVRIAARPGGPSLWDRIAALPRLVWATLRGEYRGVGLGRLALIAGATGYVISPVDLLPELFLGFAGLLDDAVVLGWVATQVVTETESFLTWERARAEAGAASGPTGGPAAHRTVQGEVIG